MGNEIACTKYLSLNDYDTTSKTFVHEFGHQFGKLDDEYVGGGIMGRKNCYVGSIESCLKQSPWKEFIGDGCGKDDIIDCKEGIDAEYKIEIGCFEGCDGHKVGEFRSAFSTIMRYSTNDPFSFGLWNEKLIKDELDKFSGE